MSDLPPYDHSEAAPVLRPVKSPLSPTFRRLSLGKVTSTQRNRQGRAQYASMLLSSPVILSWDPSIQALPEDNEHHPSSPQDPANCLSGFRVPGLLTSPVAYALSPIAFNSMSLVPTAGAADERPQYHISVSMNCLNPSSFITTIRRGDYENGEYVGDFEMGPWNSEPTVSIRGEISALKKVFKYSQKVSSWNVENVSLFWHTGWHYGSLGTKPFSRECYQTKDRESSDILAKFTPGRCPSNSVSAAGQPIPLALLEIYPNREGYFDDILMSALILERIRTCKATEH